MALVIFEHMFYNIVACLRTTTALPQGLIAVSYHEQIATFMNASPASPSSGARTLETSQGQTGWVTDRCSADVRANSRRPWLTAPHAADSLSILDRPI